MFNKLFSLIIVCLLFISTAIKANDIEKRNDIITDAENWLVKIDSNKYSQSWKEASDYFRNAVPENKWIKSLNSARAPLGKINFRTKHKNYFKKSLAGAPDGEYLIIIFASSFENKKTAFETVTFMKDRDGKWRAAGYFIN